MYLRHPVQCAPWPGEVPRADRIPGEETQTVPLADLEHVLRCPVTEVVPVLHRDDLHQRPGSLQLLDADVRQADVTDLPLRPELDQLSERVLHRYCRVDRVQLVDVDP